MPISTRHSKEDINQELREIVLRHVSRPAVVETAVPGLFFVKRTSENCEERCFTRPVCSLIIQGTKSARIGAGDYVIGPNQCLVCGVDMPSAGCFVFSEEEPFLAMYFHLDREILLDLVMRMRPEERPDGSRSSSVSVGDAGVEFMNAMLHMAELVDKPTQIPVMAPLAMRAMHYLLLTSPQGAALHHLFRSGSLNSQIVHAIAIMKDSITKPLRIDQLAGRVNMSVSSLHRHFKSVTGFSPLQYHKNLRLYEAQRLMLVENLGAASAAIAVGYESPTQFSREYKRLFGEPPHRDISRRRFGPGPESAAMPA